MKSHSRQDNRVLQARGELEDLEVLVVVIRTVSFVPKKAVVVLMVV